jgi:hypothetical protein
MLNNNPLVLITSVQKNFRARVAADIKVPPGTSGITVTVISKAEATDVIQLTQLGLAGEYCVTNLLVSTGHKRLPVLRGVEFIQVDSYIDVTLQVMFYRLEELDFFAGQNGLSITVGGSNEDLLPVYEHSTAWWSFKDNSSSLFRGVKVLEPAMLVACLALGEGLIENNSFRGTVIHIVPLHTSAQQFVITFASAKNLSVRFFSSDALEETRDIQTGASSTSLANTNFPVIQAPQHANV